MGPGDNNRDRQEPPTGRAIADLHLAKSISHLTLALEALELADIALACGYVDLALTICVDERTRRAGEAGG